MTMTEEIAVHTVDRARLQDAASSIIRATRHLLSDRQSEVAQAQLEGHCALLASLGLVADEQLAKATILAVLAEAVSLRGNRPVMRLEREAWDAAAVEDLIPRFGW